MKAVEMLQGIASGARKYGNDETAAEAEKAAGEANELYDAALSLFDDISHSPASEYTGVKVTALDRLRTVLMRIERSA